MPTAESVKAKIQSLIDQANTATGGQDADLTTAVNTLIAGFGDGSGGGVSGMYSGSFTPADNLLEVKISVGAVTENFLIYATSGVTGKSVKASALFFRNRTIPLAYGIPTNNLGSALSVWLSNFADSDNPDGSKFAIINNTRITYTPGGIVNILTSSPNGTCLGYFIAGVTYNWLAW